MHLTLCLDMAFEMVEVRTGTGLKPLYRGVKSTGNVGAVGAEMRTILKKTRADGECERHVESLGEMWKGEWEEGGNALKNPRQLLTDCCRRE